MLENLAVVSSSPPLHQQIPQCLPHSILRQDLSSMLTSSQTSQVMINIITTTRVTNTKNLEERKYSRWCILIMQDTSILIIFHA